ncbi:GntR family transcriptional regulator [Streptomyces canus]|uniref:GntR family transcriptional regulator n=1 Tax=Streptomyces canus TaxID=58343 RepID=UPI002258C017|nr:GntR family transcriptional regulator [Streptomyces canus]MCX4859207.1 GntR family transcriptional regulator [Streptomyces canus]WSW35556.1 GntR family transcriptional regulator [Streptomyces canus]
MSTGSGADEGGRKSQELKSALLADITEGEYDQGALLPPQRELAKKYEVSRDTVQRVLGVLADEGWIESRQGRGSVVLRTQTVRSSVRENAAARRVTLGPLIAAAFAAPDVTLDVFTLTSEVLYTHVRVQEERIRAREIRPATITIRMLTPPDGQRLPFPCAPDAPDDDRPQRHLQGIRKYHTDNLLRRLQELGRDIDGLSATVEIRRVPLVPYSKLYILNGAEVVTGPYVPTERPITLDDGSTLDVVDVMGFDSTLTHCAKDDDPQSQDSLIVSSWQRWFDSTWRLLAT